MNIGHVIAQLRTENNLSQRELAKKLNVSSSAIALWETNKRLPTIETLVIIADFFNISMDLIFAYDRKNTYSSEDYNYFQRYSPDLTKIIDTFNLLSEDNRDILIGEAKKLLKQQRIEEKSGSNGMREAK